MTITISYLVPVIYSDGQSSLRRSCEEELPKVTSPALTGSDISYVSGSGITGSHRVRMRNRYIWYYYYSSSTKCSTVVQVPWLPELTEGHALGCPEEGSLVCADAQPEVVQYSL